MVWRYIRAIVVLPPLFCKWCCKINVKVVPTVFCKWCCKIDEGKWCSLYFCDWRLVEIMMHAFDHIFKKKNEPTRALFRLFLVFSNKQYNVYNKSMWKNVQMYIQNTQHRGSNPTPFEHESSPITTRPYFYLQIPISFFLTFLSSFKARVVRVEGSRTHHQNHGP